MHDQVTTINPTRTNLAPIPMECDAPFLKITGELPRELNGTLYRNGPNPQFDAPGAHWFVGDGMLHAFHLENGRAGASRPPRARWIPWQLGGGELTAVSWCRVTAARCCALSPCGRGQDWRQPRVRLGEGLAQRKD